MPFGVPDINSILQAGGLYPKLSTAIHLIAMTKQIAKQMFTPYSMVGIQSNAVTFPKEKADRRKIFSRTEAGALIPIDYTGYEYILVKPYKIGEGFSITREALEDNQLPVVTNQMTRKALVLGQTMDMDGIISLLANYGSTFSCAGKSLGFDGTVYTKASTVGTQDINNAVALIKQVNYDADCLLVNANVEAQLRMLPHFSQAFSYGSVNGPSPLVTGKWDGNTEGSQGMVGKILGLDVFVSNNVLDDPTGKAGTLNNRVLALAREGKNPMGQFSPIGYYCEKRPPTVETEIAPSRDSQLVWMTARYAYGVVKKEPICMMDSCGTFVEGTAPIAL